MNKYVRNAKIIDQAFDAIKKNSGITKLDEIVTTYLKAEEQNYQLAGYFNIMDGECDKIKAENDRLDSEITIYEEMAIGDKAAQK